MNPVIDLISSHNVEFKKKKKGQPIKKKKLSLNAERGGLIPLIPFRLSVQSIETNAFLQKSFWFFSCPQFEVNFN
jgi:hypothetical protein